MKREERLKQKRPNLHRNRIDLMPQKPRDRNSPKPKWGETILSEIPISKKAIETMVNSYEIGWTGLELTQIKKLLPENFSKLVLLCAPFTGMGREAAAKVVMSGDDRKDGEEVAKMFEISHGNFVEANKKLFEELEALVGLGKRLKELDYATPPEELDRFESQALIALKSYAAGALKMAEAFREEKNLNHFVEKTIMFMFGAAKYHVSVKQTNESFEGRIMALLVDRN
jgi:hypothetical protein